MGRVKDISERGIDNDLPVKTENACLAALERNVLKNHLFNRDMKIPVKSFDISIEKILDDDKPLEIKVDDKLTSFPVC